MGCKRRVFFEKRVAYCVGDWGGLVNVSVVQGFMEFTGVGYMLLRGGGKVVPAAEVYFGTEV